MGFFDSDSETTTTIPEGPRQFRNTVFGNAKEVTNRDFPEYDPEDRVSPLTDDQRASYQMARNTIGSTQPYSQSALNSTAARQDPNTRTATIGGSTPTASAYKIDPGATENVNAQTVDARTFPEADLDQYMNPYIDKVVDETAQEMQRNLDIAQNKQMQDFAAAGAFGGARQAIAQSENIRNFADKIGQETARLRSQGFRRAQDQIGQDQNRLLEAARSNQQADLEAARANQQADLEARLSNQDAITDTRQFNAQLGMEGQLADQQAINNMRQFNQRLGLAASDQLSNLATDEQQRQQQDIGFLNEMGRQQQQQDQRLRDAAYQEFQRRVQWPERQLGLRSDVLAGAPVGRTQQTTTSPSGASYIGAGASLLGGADDIIGGIESVGDFLGF